MRIGMKCLDVGYDKHRFLVTNICFSYCFYQLIKKLVLPGKL